MGSCRKDAITELTDPDLVKYFGDWIFIHTYNESDFLWVPDSVDGHYELFSHTDIDTSEGQVKMGRMSGELWIELSPEPYSGFYVTIDDWGNLTCTGNCENVPCISGNGSGAQHTLTESTYYLDVGSISSGSSSDYWKIDGVKL